MLEYATILERQNGQVYVHYTDQDKRLDEWVDEVDCTPVDNVPEEGDSNSRKRKRRSPFSSRPSSYSEDFQEDDPPVTGEDLDIKQHKQITAQRNFETVHFGNYQIKTWYFSPYPLTDEEELSQQSIAQGPKIAGVARATARSHGRTSDLLAGGLHRYTNDGHRADLYVCDLCFKYMAEPSSWEAHKKGCTLKYPPGRKVYERGPRAIWEVDGAQQKLYCQNLSLFGKLFIDVKTLFFDCDNFLFYILTEGTSIHTMLGFFSKECVLTSFQEKISYDDYNLACIMTLPPKQRQGYGTLMIEFSYELSRRAGKVGTPERPLSDLGLRGYLQFWVSHIVRFFRQVLTALPSDFERIRTVGNLPDLTKNPPGELPESLSKKRKRGKSGDGDDPGAYVPFTDPMFMVNRVFETVQREDGVAEIHVSVQCTLADIARATDLRIEDTAFALNECGLLMRRFTEGDENETIIITRELVEKAAAELRPRWAAKDNKEDEE
ncbi:putative MYST-like histone acetyltransferase 1 [Leucoagaricus sp. SymC.cos]|nr:putative MYST-like histone acetyltransferase 1 [Leucoagaricus sp. SymC.cos]